MLSKVSTRVLFFIGIKNMAYIKSSGDKQPNLFSAIAIGVGCIIGSGWLFASYKAAKFAGPIAIGSWVIGAVLALMIAL